MVLGVVATVCFVAAGALLVRVHLLPTGLNPARDAVSDYGTTRFHLYYRVTVVCQGAGALLLAIGLARGTDATGLAWLWVYGVSRIAIAGVMTDPGPSPVTTEGRVHLLLASTAFAAIAVAGLKVDWTGAPGVLEPLGVVVALAAVGTLITRVVVPLRAVFGLVQRSLYLTKLTWLLVAAVDLLLSD